MPISHFRNPASAYYRILIANAATSALRLHQRLPTMQISVQFLTQLFKEDSCHYLLYSVIFLYVSPNIRILSIINTHCILIVVIKNLITNSTILIKA